MTRWLDAAQRPPATTDKTDLTDLTKGNAPTPLLKEVLSEKSVLSVKGISITAPPSAPASLRTDGNPFRHGRSVTGSPLTWTGRIVSLTEWRRLSEWERDGSTGKLWNGITQQWEPAKC